MFTVFVNFPFENERVWIQDGTLNNVNQWQVDFLVIFDFFYKFYYFSSASHLGVGHDHLEYESLTSWDSVAKCSHF